MLKICRKCKVEQPLDCFHKKADTKDGHKLTCKSCNNQANKDRYIKNKDVILSKHKQYYEGNKEKILARGKAYCIKNKDKKAQYHKGYFTKNKDNITSKHKQYYEANKEKILGQGKEYREVNKEVIRSKDRLRRAINKEVDAKRIKQWRIKNEDSIAQQKQVYYTVNKDKLAIKIKQYQQSPMGKLVMKNTRHKRRSISKQGDVTTAQLLQLTQNATNCVYCQADLKETGFHIDHFVPLSKGGLHSLSNLVVACPTCNRRKSAKDPFEFLLEISEKYDILAQHEFLQGITHGTINHRRGHCST